MPRFIGMSLHRACGLSTPSWIQWLPNLGIRSGFRRIAVGFAVRLLIRFRENGRLRPVPTSLCSDRAIFWSSKHSRVRRKQTVVSKAVLLSVSHAHGCAGPQDLYMLPEYHNLRYFACWTIVRQADSEATTCERKSKSSVDRLRGREG